MKLIRTSVTEMSHLKNVYKILTFENNGKLRTDFLYGQSRRTKRLDDGMIHCVKFSDSHLYTLIVKYGNDLTILFEVGNDIRLSISHEVDSPDWKSLHKGLFLESLIL